MRQGILLVTTASARSVYARRDPGGPGDLVVGGTGGETGSPRLVRLWTRHAMHPTQGRIGKWTLITCDLTAVGDHEVNSARRGVRSRRASDDGARRGRRASKGLVGRLASPFVARCATTFTAP